MNIPAALGIMFVLGIASCYCASHFIEEKNMDKFNLAMAYFGTIIISIQMARWVY